MFEFIKEAGFPIYPVLAFGLAGIFVAGKHIGAPHPKSVTTAIWLMALTLLTGVLGTVTGMQKSAEYIHQTPEKWIFLLGLRESLNNLVGAGVLVSLTMLLLLVAHQRQGPTAVQA